MIVTVNSLGGTRPTILLLEDDDGVRRALQLLLQGQGYDVRAHAAGVSLLADSHVTQATLLIADYRVEDIDGIAVLTQLRLRAWEAPAILVTAHCSADLQRRAAEAGYAAVLDKPLRQRSLVNLVSRLTGIPRGGGL